MRVGGVELINGKIVTLSVDSVSTAPNFDAARAGEFTFSDDDKVLRFNNGENLVPLNTTVSENPNLITSLGDNWLNNDLSFNPVPFDALTTVSVDGNDDLFVVISQLDEAIAGLSDITLGEIDVPESSTEWGIATYREGVLWIEPIGTVLNNSSVQIKLSNISGFAIDDYTEGNMLAFNDDRELVSKRTHYRYENLTANPSHIITHNFGEKYVSVFCINPKNNKMIIPTEIDFSTSNQCNVFLSEPSGLIALVTNLPRG